MREWPDKGLSDRFRFGTYAGQVFPTHGISTAETPRFWERWLAQARAAAE